MTPSSATTLKIFLKNIRTQVVLKIVQPYTRIRIPFVSKQLNIPERDVEQLLVSLILDDKIQGHIDQVCFNIACTYNEANGLSVC